MSNDDLNDWTIGYVRHGEPKVFTIESEHKPDLATIAVRMRNEPGFDEFIIPDTFRDSSTEENAEAFLKYNGIPVEQITVDGPGKIASYRDSE